MVILRGRSGHRQDDAGEGHRRRPGGRLARRRHQPYFHSHPRVPRPRGQPLPRRSVRIDTRASRTAGLDELFAEEGNLVLLEWGKKFPRFEKERDVEIVIERRGDQERKIVVKRK